VTPSIGICLVAVSSNTTPESVTSNITGLLGSRLAVGCGAGVDGIDGNVGVDGLARSQPASAAMNTKTRNPENFLRVITFPSYLGSGKGPRERERPF
jgi:hypothetical protein